MLNFKISKSIFGKIIFASIQAPRIIFFRLISYGRISGSPVLNQPLHTAGRGLIRFTGKVNIGVTPSPYYFSSYAYIEARSASAVVQIGDGTSINNGFCAIAEHSSIKIGSRVLIGTNVEIFDSDFHGIAIADRSLSRIDCASAVNIGDDVFLGSNVRILKGVSIGHGSIVANSSVVVKDIPAGVIAGGNPARVIRAID